MRFSITGRQLLFYGLVIFITGAVIGSVSLTYPFGRDQAIYAYAGKLILEGKMNYLYTFDLKPPGIHFLFAFIQLISSESMLNARIFDIIWQSTTALLIFLCSVKLTGEKRISLIISLFYIFLYFRQDYWHTLQTDGSLNLFFVLSVLLLLVNYDSHSFVRIFLAGITIALALLIKYTIIVFIPLIILAFLIDKRYLFSLRLKNIAVYFVGIALIGLITLAVYYFTGALQAFWDIQFVQTPLYTKIAYETEIPGFISSQVFKLFLFSVYSPFIWLSVFSVIYSILKKNFEFKYLIIYFWIFASLFSLIIQWKFYNYHFLVIIPAILLGSAMGLSGIKSVFSAKRFVFPAIAAVFVIGVVFFGMKPYFLSYQSVYSYVSGRTTLENEYTANGFTSDSVFMYGKTIKAVEFIKNNTKPEDKIYVWGFDPLVYYLSGRKCSSRFIYNFPLLWKGENAQFRSEFINQVETDNPKIVIVAKNDPLKFISGYDEDSKKLLKRFPEFDKIVSEKYYYTANADDYEIFELKNW